MKRIMWWLRIFSPACPFLFLEIDRITKNRAIIAGEYTLSPHFLSFVIPFEMVLGIGIVLIALCAIFYCVPWVLHKTPFEFRRYFFDGVDPEISHATPRSENPILPRSLY